MNFSFKQTAALLVTTLSLGTTAIAPAFAQGAVAINTGLTENEGYIRGCRETNTTVEITSPVTPPNYGWVWLTVALNGTDGTRGWIARTGVYGSGSNVTPVACP